MPSLSMWTLIIIGYQTIICIIISWATLGCQLSPNHTEYNEVNLVKLLYLYDPQACGRSYFYNYTIKYSTLSVSKVIWPRKNPHAAAFRSKVTISVILHVSWLVLAAAYSSVGLRSCSFYIALVPFSATGAAVLVLDVVHTILFMLDSVKTGTEIEILRYINGPTKTNILIVHKHPNKLDLDKEADTTWVALVMAFLNCRCIVQWIINFWLVKDNYYIGLEVYRRNDIEAKYNARRMRRKSRYDVM